jgi:hypothetical protein
MGGHEGCSHSVRMALLVWPPACALHVLMLAGRCSSIQQQGPLLTSLEMFETKLFKLCFHNSTEDSRLFFICRSTLSMGCLGSGSSASKPAWHLSSLPPVKPPSFPLPQSHCPLHKPSLPREPKRPRPTQRRLWYWSSHLHP